MLKVRLQTKFLLSLLLVSAGLTCATLVVVQQTIQKQVQGEIFDDLHNSLLTFQNVQRQRESNLAHSAGLLANLPTLKALMTTSDAVTIQDASGDLWRLAGSSLFVLADRAGKVVALHTATSGFSRTLAQQSLQQSLSSGEPRHWWFGGGHLYEVFLQPVYFGEPGDNSLLGVLAVGYEIDDQAVRDISRVAAGEVAFRYGATVVASTLPASQQAELATRMPSSSKDIKPQDLRLHGERFLATSVQLSAGHAPSVQLIVFKSYDLATAFLQRLNRLLLAMGVASVALGTLLVFIISPTFTRPLKALVAGVRSLETGDYAYPLERRGDDEVAEVTSAFDRMRQNLRKTQQQLLESERLATIGTMASSISHDLRHSLTAMVANAEFLCAMELNKSQREDLYQEIRVAVDQMTDLIESLLEFSRTRASLNFSFASVEDIARRAVGAARAHPDWQRVEINIISDSSVRGWFDEKKLQRVFYNLLLNACEAVPPDKGRVQILIRQEAERLEVRVRDNGSGIPQDIRNRVFQPFVSSGKQNGTGMGLAVVQKIVQDHGGDITVESTSSEGTVFKITLTANRQCPTNRMEAASSEFVRDARTG